MCASASRVVVATVLNADRMRTSWVAIGGVHLREESVQESLRFSLVVDKLLFVNLQSRDTTPRLPWFHVGGRFPEFSLSGFV